MKNSRIITAALCIVALALGETSCRKDKDGNTPGEPMTIGASIEQADSDAKTFLAPGSEKVNIFWSENDKIKLFGAGDTHGEEFRLTDGEGSASGTFEGTAPAPYSPYYAAYPETATFDGGSTFTFTIPATITGVAAQPVTSDHYSFIQKSCVPMVGVSVHENELKFYSAMSSVFIALKGGENDQVTKIVLTDLSGHAMNGTLTVKQDDNTHGIDFGHTSLTGDSNTLTLNLQQAVTLDEEKYSMFCFPVPKGAFAGTEGSKNVNIKVYNGENVIAEIEKGLQAGVTQNAAYAVVETITGSTTITASTTSFSTSKTDLDPSTGKVDVKWSEDDMIQLFGNSDTQGQTFTLQSGAGTTTATFKGILPASGPTYYAAYPAPKSFNGSGTFTFEVLPTQTHSVPNLDSYFPIDNYNGPMVGVLTGTESPSITFSNAMIPLYLSLNGNGTINTIKLTDKSGANLTGTLNVQVKSDGSIQSSSMSGGSNTMTLDLGEGVPLDPVAYHSFCFPVPVGAFSGTDNMQIEIYEGVDKIADITKSFPSGVSAGSAIEVTETVKSSITLTAALAKPDGSNWSTGDEIKVYGQAQSDGKVFTATAATSNVTFTGKLPTGEYPYYAVYTKNSVSFTYSSGTATIEFSVPSTIDYSSSGSYNGPMAGYSGDGSTMTFYNAMSSVNVSLKGTSKVRKIELIDLNSSSTPLSGTLTVNVNSTGISSSSMSGSTHTLTMNVSDIQLSSTPTVFCFPVPAGAFKSTSNTYPMKIKIYDENNNLVNVFHQQINSTSGISSGSTITASREVPKHSDYVIPYKFTGNNTTVNNGAIYFARGNLYAEKSGSSITFKFENSQLITPQNYDENHIGHFFYRNDQAKACAKTTSLAGSLTGRLFTNVNTNSTSTSPDKIEIPNSNFTVEGKNATFFVLSSSSISNKMFKRTGNIDGPAKGKYLLGKAIVTDSNGNEIEGFMLFPDDWDGLAYPSFEYPSSAPSTSSSTYSVPNANKFDYKIFEEMEANGAVFLSNNGHGNGSTNIVGDGLKRAYYLLGTYNSYFGVIEVADGKMPGNSQTLSNGGNYWCTIRCVSSSLVY